MIRNLMALPCMLALVLACGQGRSDGQDTGAAAGTGSESGALPADTGYDRRRDRRHHRGTVRRRTAITALRRSDGGIREPGSVRRDHSETGDSERGGDVTETTPDQGEPVTSKGDTVGAGGEGATSDTAQ